MTHFDAASLNPRSTAPVLPTATVVRITLICFAVSMIDGFDTLMLSFVAPLLAHSLHIDHAALGRVFGAGFVGTVLGSLIAGPLADRFGRRPMLLLALAVTGVFTLACAFAGSATSLATLRFLGGLGMGGAIPAVAAITAESSTTQRRSSLVILMFIGFPLGAVVGGAITAALMMRFGWPFVFLMGGICALVAIVPVLLVIPSTSAARTEVVAPSTHRSLAGRAFGSFVGDLLADGRLASTLALWFGVLSSMILSGFLVSFMPTILNLNGIAPDRAALGAVILNLGAIVGALLISAVVGRIGPFVPVAISFACGAVLVFALGRVIGTGNAAFGMLFITGACLVGGQLTIPAIASRLFPTPVRAAGIGWTMAIGRMGSIIGPLVGGILLAQKLPLEQIFVIAALLAVCGSLGIALVAAWRPREDVDARAPTSPFTITHAESGNGKS
ncbi:MFS transporter [Paraburkholderia megapolitana]|uniref:MFS transporter, AAHS family, 4-hydroxybenzoate transporter n=1 Tax=Paraburkholderia megapolitana TaxID=420953 RepID=A0A1I3NUN9_9BURK|nr:MFS transporter [Paraburkholderia megapolitana]QDQ84506.1 aromatic acid/H+ symport family MFS transporter [Paraburkholderia megapolitana]SFJ12919.1 MFS transporter, AAHS family, 4-hydroxybenzoate transporter [Paraburkholderia megapolitana]